MRQRSDARRARCLPGGIQADKVPLWYCRGRWRKSSSSRYPEGYRSCEAIPGGHAVSRLAFRQTKYPCGIAAVAGAKVRHRDTLKGTGPAKRSPCWHSGRLPRSLAQKFVIASLRSDLPVDLAGDWFSSRDSGRLPRSLTQKFVIASLRSDLPVDLAGDWFSRRDSGRQSTLVVLPRSLALPRNDGMLGHRESIPGGHAVSRLAYREGTGSPGWHSGRLPRSLTLPRNDGMLGHREGIPGGHGVFLVAHWEIAALRSQ